MPTPPLHRPAPPLTRATASLLCAALVALNPWSPAVAAGAKAAPSTVVVVPFAQLPGAPEAGAARLWARVLAELKTRPELKIVDPPADGATPEQAAAKAKAEVEKASALAREQVAKAAELSKKGKASQAATALLKACSALLANPLAVDVDGGTLLADATLQMAVARAMSGNEEGSDEALNDLVRRSPDRAVSGADFPPAFVRAWESARVRVLSSPRGALRVLAPAGEGPARVLLDGRSLGSAPVLLAEVPSGIHVVRVERAGEAWAETVTLAAGAEIPLQPRLGPAAAGAAAELTSTLSRGQLNRPAAARAAKLARAAGAKAALLGAVAKDGDGLSARSFLVLAKGDRVVPLSAMALDAEMLGASLEVLRLADDLIARLATPPPEPPLPVSLGTAAADAAELPSVTAAPAAPEVAPGGPGVSAADLAKAAGVNPAREAPAAAASSSGADAGTPAVAKAAAPATEAGGGAASAASSGSSTRKPVLPGSLDAAVAGIPPAPASAAATPPAAAADTTPAAAGSAAAAPSASADAAQAPAQARRAIMPGEKAPPPAALPAPVKAPVAAEEAKEPARPSAAASAPDSSTPKAPVAASDAAAAPRSVIRPGSLEAATAATNSPAASSAPGSRAPEPSPGSELVIPRRRDDRDDEAPAAAAKTRPAPVAATRMEAREANEVATVREQQQPAKSHTVLSIIAGVLVAGGAGAGGYALYQSTRTASSATVSATWTH